MSIDALRERLTTLNAPAEVLFPSWTDKAIRGIVLLAVLGAPTAPLLVAYGASPLTMNVGYAPVQPIPYSHALHVGELGIDCRYCHTSVETTARANVPPTQTCMNCHAKVMTKSAALAPLRESFETGNPVEWVRVHDLPDHAAFNHSAHVTRGIGCVSCHGRVDTMDIVRQEKALSMSWCLDCHRHPEKHLRPPEEATNMQWTPPNGEDPYDFGKRFMRDNHISPRQDCSTCHR